MAVERFPYRAHLRSLKPHALCAKSENVDTGQKKLKLLAARYQFHTCGIHCHKDCCQNRSIT